MNILSKLGIWKEVKTQGGLPARILKSSFRENLFKGIFAQQSQQPRSLDFQIEENGSQTTPNGVADLKLIEKIDQYAIERWEAVLKYIVNPKDAKNQINISTKQVLKFAGLMKSAGRNADREMEAEDDVILTAAAFQFLLWNRKLQIWYFIIQLLEYSLKV